MTQACWVALNDLICPEPDRECYAGWWIGWSDVNEIVTSFPQKPFRFELAPTSDADWFVWACTSDQALSAGSFAGRFRSPTLWIDPLRQWAVIGSPTTVTFHIAGPVELLAALQDHSDVHVEALLGPSDLAYD
jgi:hypothetical protein